MKSVDLDLKLADTKFASLNMYVDKEQIQVALPQFFTAVLSETSFPCLLQKEKKVQTPLHLPALQIHLLLQALQPDMLPRTHDEYLIDISKPVHFDFVVAGC